MARVDLDAVMLAYGATVHISQELEYPVAVIGPPRASAMAMRHVRAIQQLTNRAAR